MIYPSAMGANAKTVLSKVKDCWVDEIVPVMPDMDFGSMTSNFIIPAESTLQRNENV